MKRFLFNYISLLCLFPILNVSTFAQDFSELLTTYDPSGLVFQAGNGLRKCNDKVSQLPIPEKMVPGYLLPIPRVECQPDTLYSWGTIEKAEAIFADLESKKDWRLKLKRPLYTSPFPAATFPYGPIPLRIKLKPDVKFETRSDYCPRTINRHNAKTVYYANKVFMGIGSLYEIVICSADVIESISYGTHEHYDEVIRDIIWSTTPGRDPKEYYTYTQGVGGEKVSPRINFEGKPFIHFSNGKIPEHQTIDGMESSCESLHRHLLEFRELADYTGGKIIYNPNSIHGDHFMTKIPMYYNPY